MTYSEAAAVTSFSEYVFTKTNIVHFTELAHFGVTSIRQCSFASCPNLRSIAFGPNVAQYGSHLFDGDSNLETIYFYRKAAAPVTDDWFSSDGLGKNISADQRLVYVPADATGYDGQAYNLLRYYGYTFIYTL